MIRLHARANREPKGEPAAHVAPPVGELGGINYFVAGASFMALPVRVL